jgi:hypothetical protein
MRHLPLPIEDCFKVLMLFPNGPRNRALYSLRQTLRLKDIICLNCVGDVVSSDGSVSGSVQVYNGARVVLDSRSRTMIYLYLVKRFRLCNLRAADQTLPLFKTAKSDYLTVERLAQLFCEMDSKIRRSAGVSTVRATPNIGVWTTVFNHRTLDDVGSQ